MEKREFQAESRRLLDLVINSIYTNREIFLRELISNASDAIDKIYYKALTDEDLNFNKEDYYIKISSDKDNKKLTIKDTGIGMTKKELDENLGVIAKSGSYEFKSNNKLEEDHDIIGQFGVGFYSAFMVADRVIVKSKALGEEKSYQWISRGEEGYTIEETDKEDVGTEIILELKEDQEGEDYSQYLEAYRIKEIIKKYSDYIRYPIKMEVTRTRLKEGSDDEYEEYREEEILNSMVPIWRKNRNELKEEDYKNFYQEKRFGFDEPIKSIHMLVDGLLRFQSILFIPKERPFNFYTKDYEKGLELYSSGVMIMEKCSDLLPDYLSFVKGVVDSEDLSLNISRETLQQDRQLHLIAKNIENRVLTELKTMLDKEPNKYKEFFDTFGSQLKYGAYENFGMNKEKLQDLLIFPTSKADGYRSFADYKKDMLEDQPFIYYVAGDSIDRVGKIPQVELLNEKGYEVLYLLEEVDEFLIKIINDYEEIQFKSVVSEDLGIDLGEDRDLLSQESKKNKELFSEIKNILKDKVVDVKPSNRLRNNPVAFSTEGEISIEMEKFLSQLPENENIKANKVLEINIDHEIFKKLKDSFEASSLNFEQYANLLYDQACLIEGLEIEDPIEFSNNIWKLI